MNKNREYNISNSWDFHNMYCLKSKWDPVYEEEKKAGDSSSYLLSTPPSLNLDISLNESQLHNNDIIVSELVLEDLGGSNTNERNQSDSCQNSNSKNAYWYKLGLLEMIGTAEIIKLFSNDDKEKTNSEDNFKVRLSDSSSKHHKQEKLTKNRNTKTISNILPNSAEIYTKDVRKSISKEASKDIFKIMPVTNGDHEVYPHSHKHYNSVESKRLINEKWISKNFNTISDEAR